MKEIKKLLNNYRTIVFMDFEGSQYSQEIIAVGAIKADLDAKNKVKKTYAPFKCYIRVDEIVGEFITKLTGITDELLKEQGLSFCEAFEKFEQYIGKSEVKFMTYGSFDMHLLHNSALNSGVNDDPFIRKIYDNNIDFARVFGKYVKSEKYSNLSLTDGLKVFKTNVEKNIHDPLTDSINLMHLYDAFLTKQNILKEEYEKVLINSPALPLPFKKIIKKLESEQKVTYKDFLSYVEDDIK